MTAKSRVGRWWPYLAALVGGGAVVWWAVGSGSDPCADVRAKVGTRAATARLAELRQEYPRNAEVHFLSARQARLANDPAAVSHLLRAEELGWDARQLARERTLRRAAGSAPDGRGALGRLLENDPDDADARLGLAELDLATGRDGQAVELAERVLARSPDDPRALLARGTARFRARELRLARTDFEQALARHPDALVSNRVRLALGMCLLDLGDFGRAHDMFTAVTAETPDDLLALFGVGRSACYLGRFADAEAAFLAVLKRRPGHVETLISLAQVVEQKGELGRAIRYLEEAERGDPNRLETHSRLAKLLAESGREEQAARHEARFRELDPEGKKPKPKESP